MRMKDFTLLVVAGLLLLGGCATAPKKDLTAFRSDAPRSILVVPPLNKSCEVSAGDYLLTTIPIPVAEHGYYIFPSHVVKRLLEDDGLSDAALVHGADTRKLCNLFGADAVLYPTIEQWDAKYMVFSTQVTVGVDYTVKSCKTGDVIWNDKRIKVYVPQNQNTGNPLANLIVMAVSAAMTKAAPNYMPLARELNQEAFKYPGPGFPAGPYHPDYGKDEEIAQKKPEK
jgi:hypothetical protein